MRKQQREITNISGKFQNNAINDAKQICSFYRTLPSATWQDPYGFFLFSTYCYSFESLKP